TPPACLRRRSRPAWDASARPVLPPLSLHDAPPSYRAADRGDRLVPPVGSVDALARAARFASRAPRPGRSALRVVVLARGRQRNRSEEHTPELQSRENLVCRLLLEKNNLQDPGTHGV